MRFCSYNIQFGTGKDDRVDFDRIAADVGAADVICLQEVERFFAGTGNTDQVAEIAGRFPDHHWVYGPGVDLDADVAGEDGRPLHRRRQFGNMLLARSPILSARNHLLPKYGMVDQLSLQRAALEGVIDTAAGPLRIYSVHLGHAAAAERNRQCRRLMEIVRDAPDQGGVFSGRDAGRHWTADGPPPPMPRAAILMGDFNLVPDSAEYQILAGTLDRRYGRVTPLDGLVDAWIASGNEAGATCETRAKGTAPTAWERIDYAFVTPDLAGRIAAMTVDADAQGSDHQPIFVDIDL